MSSIDERIVQMQFENSQFEKGIKESLKSLEELKESLQLEKAAEGLRKLQEVGDHFSLAKIGEGIDSLGERFSAFGTFASRIVENLADTVYNKLGGAIESVTVGQISAGWRKYAEDTQAVQTIMFATGESIEKVENELRKLTWFTDETSYSYTDMVGNISKFTSNQIGLEDSRVAMQGIATWAASAGQNAQTASRAMYNISQAMGMGAMKVADWRSIEIANMATADFKKNAIEAAKALGVLNENGEYTETLASGKIKKTLVTIDGFRETLSTGWFNRDVMMKVFGEYGEFAEKVQQLVDETGMDTSDAIAELSGSTALFSENAFKAAQEAKTFEEAVDALRDATSTKWLNIFKLVFGNYEEAKVLWTKLANDLYEIFVDPLDSVIESMKAWREDTDEYGHHYQSGWSMFMQGVNDFMDGLKGLLITVRDAFNNLIPGSTLDHLMALSKGMADFGAAFKEAFGLPEEVEELGDTVSDVTSAVSEGSKAINGSLDASKENITELNAEYEKLERNLKRGAKGDDVRKLQEALIDAGYLDENQADGIYGPKTEAAVRKLQKEYGVAIDGIYGPITHGAFTAGKAIDETNAKWKALEKNLEEGSKGEDVLELQKRLDKLGYDVGPLDGIYGPKTKAAVEKWEKDMGLAVDGIYDKADDHEAMKKKLGIDDAVEATKSITKQTKEAQDATEKYGTKLDRVRAIAGGIFAAGGIILKVIGAIGKGIAHVWELTAPLRDAFEIAAAAIGEVLIRFNNWLGTSGAIEKWFGSVEDKLKPFGDWIKSAADGFLLFFGLKKPVADSNKEISTFSDLWKGITDALGKTGIFKNISNAITTVRTSIEKILKPTKEAGKSFKKNLGTAFQNVLKGVGTALMILIAPIGIVIDLLSKLIAFVIGQIPKGIEILKNLWSALTFEGDVSLGKGPGILAKAKNFAESIRDFLFGKTIIDQGGRVEHKAGIFTRIASFINGDIAGFTKGLSGEAAERAIAVSETLKGVFNTIKENVLKAYSVVSYLFTGDLSNADGLSFDTIGKLDSIREFFDKIGEAITLLFTGKQSDNSILSEEIKANIEKFRTNVIGTFNNIKKTFKQIGEGIAYLFSGKTSEETNLTNDQIEKIDRFRKRFNYILDIISLLFTGKKRDGGILLDQNQLGVVNFRNSIVGYFDRIKKTFSQIGAAILYLFTGNNNGLLPQEWVDRIDQFKEKSNEIFGNIKEAFGNIWPTIRLLFTGDSENSTLGEEDIDRVMGWRDNIIGFFKAIGEAFAKVWVAAQFLFTGKGKAGVLKSDTINTILEFRKTIGKIFETIATVFSNIFGDLKDVFKDGVNFDSIKKAIESIGKNIGEFFGGLWKTAKSIVKWGIIGFILYKVLTIVSNITGFTTKLKDAIGAWKGNTESLSSQILKIAGAIALIGGAIWLLGTQMKPEQFKQGMAAFRWIIGAMVGFVALSAVFTKLKPDKDAAKLSSIVKDFAISMALIAGSIWLLATQIDWPTFWDGLGKLSILLVVLAGFSAIIMKMEKKLGGSGSLSIEGKIWQLAIVIGAMAGVVWLLGGMKWQKALTGVGSLIGIMTALGIFMRLATKTTGNIELKGLIGLSVAVGIMALIVKSLAKMSFFGMLQGLAGLGAMLAGVYFIISAFSKSATSIKTGPIIAMMLGIAAIMAVFALVIKKIKDVDPKVMLSFSGSLAIALLSFVGACLAIGKIGGGGMGFKDNGMLNGAYSIAASVLTFAAAAMVIVGVAGAVDKFLGSIGAADVFERGKTVLSDAAAGVKGFIDNLSGGDFATVIGILGGGTAIGVLNSTSKDGTDFTASGALSLVKSIGAFIVGALVVVGIAGAVDELLGKIGFEGTFERGKEVLNTAASAISDFMTTLGIDAGKLAIILAIGTIAGVATETTGVGGGAMIAGTAAVAASIGAFIATITAFVGAGGFIDEITNGGLTSAIDAGGGVLESLGRALAKFVSGFTDVFITQINEFADAIHRVREAVDGINEDTTLDEDISKALEIAGTIHGFFKDLEPYGEVNTYWTETGGPGAMYQTTAGTLSEDIKKFGEGIDTLRVGIQGVSKDRNVDADVEKAEDIATNLQEFFGKIASLMPDGAGLVEYNDNLAGLMTDVGTFGTKMGEFKTNITGFGAPLVEYDVEAAISAARAVAYFCSSLTGMDIDTKASGIAGWFSEDTAQETVIGTVGELAKAISDSKDDFRDLASGTIVDDVNASVSALEAIAHFLNFLSVGGLDLSSAESNGYDMSKLNQLLSGLTSYRQAIKDFNTDVSGIDISSIAQVINAITGFLALLSSDSLVSPSDILAGLDSNTISTRFSEIISGMNQAIANNGDSIKAVGATLCDNVLVGFSSADTKKAGDMTNKMLKTLDTYNGLFENRGKMFASGLASGVYFSARLAIESARYVAQSMLDKVTSIFNVASPSKVTTQIGRYFTEGLANGVGDNSSMAISSTQDVAESMLTTAQGTLSSLSDLLAQDIDTDPVISPVVDLTNARSAAASISSLFGQQNTGVTMTRRLVDRADVDTNGVALKQPVVEQAEGMSDLRGTMDQIRTGLNSISPDSIISEIQTMSDKFDSLAEAVSNMKLVLDTGALVGGTHSAYDKQFGFNEALRERGN